MATTTINHTLPTGETITFTVDVKDADALKATIGYPAIDAGGPDLSDYRSDDAYPVAAIEAAVAAEVGYPVAFRECTHAGADAGAYEVWTFRAVVTDDDRATVEHLGREAGALFASENPGEVLDPAATDWDATAWEADGAGYVSGRRAALWPVYQAALVAETRRLSRAGDYRLAHRDAFEADWRDGNAYHVGAEGNGRADFADLDEAIAAADSLDETCGWDVIVVECDGGNKPRVVYG